MPQASDGLHDLMDSYFGDPVGDSGPINYLIESGYTLRRDGHWVPKPGVSDYGHMTEKEYHCLAFLVQEWDYGGLVFAA